MKITAISDLHGYLPKDLPGGDVLCICGDIVPLDYQNDFTSSVAWFCLEFNRWANEQDYRKVVFIGGNHDFFLDKLSRMHRPSSVLGKLLPGMEKSRSKLVYLCDNSFEFEGVRFYGTPWIAELSRWGFYAPDDELERIYSRIPLRCDVLLTHMPPLACDMGKVLQRANFNTGCDFGSKALADALGGRTIGYALCGHVHSGNHTPCRYEGVEHLVNVSVKDENYKPYYPPFTFEI